MRHEDKYENRRQHMHKSSMETHARHMDLRMGSWRMRFGQKGWLRPMVIQMLEEGPMNGIDIMDKIQEMSHGWWRPSPGSVYPLLETLKKEGIVSKRSDGKYGLAEKYSEASGLSEELDSIFADMEGSVSYLEDLSQNNSKKFSAYRERIEDLTARLSKLE